MTENWLPVVGYEGIYDVSDAGRVRSLARTVLRSDGQEKRLAERFMKSQRVPAGHLFVPLHNGSGKATNRYVHRLVMESFVGPCPAGLEVRHLDGDPSNNRIGNLKYGTRSENVRDSIAHGTNVNASKTHCPAGHPYDDENTRRRSDGGRDCITCQKRRGAEHHQRKKQGPEEYLVSA